MSLYVSIARHEPLWVKATGNVAGGWARNDKGYGLYSRGSMPYPGDRSLEIAFNIRVRPFGDFTTFVEFPMELELSGDMADDRNPVGVFAVKRGKAGVAIMISVVEEQLVKNLDELIHLDHVSLTKKGPAQIRMNVSIGVRSSPPEPRGNIPEWDTQFFQGGLPSLGKKRP
jgi:hypothetical protein